MINVLISGAAGFAGSHLCEHIQATRPDWRMHLVCSFRHRGDTRRLESVNRTRYTLHTHDLRDDIPACILDDLPPIDYVFHVAAESHVDRSLTEPRLFIENNVAATVSVMEAARRLKPKAVFQISTDEVYGPAPKGSGHAEWSPTLPSNPYSASKACQEAVAISYWRSYGVPVVITNTMNLYGERQHPEKFIPGVIRHVIQGTVATIHGSPDDIGSRFYIHARNHADALLWLAERPVAMYPAADRPDRYNVVGEREIDNLEMAKLIARFAERPLRYVFEEFHKTRPGHDARYGLDGAKLKALGWRAPLSLEESLRKTVEWSVNHPEWMR